jgi:hypothetical protein
MYVGAIRKTSFSTHEDQKSNIFKILSFIILQAVASDWQETSSNSPQDRCSAVSGKGDQRGEVKPGSDIREAFKGRKSP